MLIFNIYNALITFTLVGIVLLVVNMIVLLPQRVLKLYASKFQYILLLIFILTLFSLIVLAFFPQKAIIYLASLIYSVAFVSLYAFLDQQLSKNKYFLLFINKNALIVHLLILKILAQMCRWFEQADILPTRVAHILLVALMRYDTDNQYSDIVNIIIERIRSESIYQLAIDWGYRSEIAVFQSFIDYSSAWLNQVKLPQKREYEYSFGE